VKRTLAKLKGNDLKHIVNEKNTMVIQFTSRPLSSSLVLPATIATTKNYYRCGKSGGGGKKAKFEQESLGVVSSGTVGEE